MNVGVAIVRNACQRPNAVAAFEADRSLTYAQLDERSARLANVLLGRFGLERGQRVALLARNRLEVPEVLGACAKAGLIYCGLNFRLGEPEYEAIFENAQPRVLITEPGYSELAHQLATRFDTAVVEIDNPASSGYENLLASASAQQPATLHEVRPDDDFCIVYTSGTTGRPKGVLFDVRAVLQHAMVAVVEYELSGESRWLMALPHNSSLQITLLPLLLVGGAVGFGDSRGFDAERFAEAVRACGATHTYLVPTMLFRLLETGVDATTMPTLTTIGYGAAPTPPERVRELVERLGPVFTQLYGMAEVASIATMLRKDDHLRAVGGDDRLLSSCGRASYAMDVRVVDESGHDLPPGERGEVIFGSPYTMKRYYGDPERTGEALIDGWMHSGDIGEFDDEGYLFVVDRKKDLIIRGGFNVVPSEIENVLYGHGAVLEAAVVGMPDEEWGERVLAVVALKAGAQADQAELTAWCRAQGLPSIKVPEQIEFMDSLPKNAVGKIAKRELRTALEAKTGAP
jgi:acyl-CoA synthetase (AMP-forming)/AMP-acid ligase II